MTTAARYRRGTPSSLPGSDRLYLDRELGKLEGVFAALPDLASQAEAEAGTLNNRIMTPQRVRDFLETGASFQQSGTGSVSRPVRSKLRDDICPEDYGAVGNGTTDDTTAFANAFAAMPNGIGQLILSTSGRYRIASNLTVPKGCSIVGRNPIPHGISTIINWATAPCILLASTATISVSDDASVTNCMIVRYGMTFPALNSSAFAGIAVTIPASSGCSISHNMIVGFGQGIYSVSGAQHRITDNFIDCQSGVKIEAAANVCYIERNYCWPFASYQASPPDPTWSERSGDGFLFTTGSGWLKVSDNYTFNYLVGFQYDSVNSLRSFNNSCDGPPRPNTIGHYITGTTTDLLLYAPQVSGQNIAIWQSVAGGSIYSYVNEIISPNIWGSQTHAILNAGGNYKIVGGNIRDSANEGITDVDPAAHGFIDNIKIARTAAVAIYMAADRTTGSLIIGPGVDLSDGNAVPFFATTPSTAFPTVASASAIALPGFGDHILVTGGTNISTITATYPGRRVTLQFPATALTVVDGSNLKLAGNFVTAQYSTLTLVCDGTYWIEVARSSN
jgi:hypothetical protein